MSPTPLPTTVPSHSAKSLTQSTSQPIQQRNNAAAIYHKPGTRNTLASGINFVGKSLTTRFLYSVMMDFCYSGKKCKNRPLLNMVEHLAIELRQIFDDGIEVTWGGVNKRKCGWLALGWKEIGLHLQRLDNYCDIMAGTHPQKKMVLKFAIFAKVVLRLWICGMTFRFRTRRNFILMFPHHGRKHLHYCKTCLLEIYTSQRFSKSTFFILAIKVSWQMRALTL